MMQSRPAPDSFDESDSSRLPVVSACPPRAHRTGKLAAARLISVSSLEIPLPVTIYGIKNCDTMKKARAWLDGRGIAYSFHDYKAAGIERRLLEGWAKTAGWEVLLNRAGTTFRALPEKDKQGLTQTKAIALMLGQPAMIKRPVLDAGGKLLVGVRPEAYEKAFGAA